MSSQLPFDYYSYDNNDDSNWGNYQYIALPELVNGFQQAFIGDQSVLGNVKRSQILYWMKMGIKELNFSCLNGVKKIELELGSTLDIILPPDYLRYVRISWLDMQSGLFHPMSVNTRVDTTATAYLQDNLAQILFDNDGEILEGMSGTEIINNDLVNPALNTDYNSGRCYRAWCENDRTIWNIDTSVNYNGTFSIDKKRIHFSSNVASNIIILEYISDGLEALDESDITVNKEAVRTLYNFVRWNLSSNQIGVAEYKVRQYEKEYHAEKRNAKIRLSGLTVAKVNEFVRQNFMWFKY